MSLLDLFETFSFKNPLGPINFTMEGVKHVIAVASGKGGVVKSTTAVNVAVCLAKTLGLQVGVLDADIYGPSIPRLLNMHEKPKVDSGASMNACCMTIFFKAYRLSNLQGCSLR